MAKKITLDYVTDRLGVIFFTDVSTVPKETQRFVTKLGELMMEVATGDEFEVDFLDLIDFEILVPEAINDTIVEGIGINTSYDTVAKELEIAVDMADFDTDDLTEGLLNQYFTEARVLSTDLDGLVNLTGNITASDTILSAFGRVKNHMEYFTSFTQGHVLFGGSGGEPVGSANFYWNNTSKQLLINTTSTSATQPIRLVDSSTSYFNFSVDYAPGFVTQINFGLLGRIWYDGNGGVLYIQNRSTQASSSNIRFVMNTTECMRITDAGNVGIGTILPSNSRLHVSGGAINLDNDNALAWGGGTDRPAILGNKTSGYLTFFTASAERFRINNLGYFGVASTNPKAQFQFGTYGSIIFPTTSTNLHIGRNIYYDYTAGNYKRLVNINATQFIYLRETGDIEFYGNSDSNTAADSVVTPFRNISFKQNGDIETFRGKLTFTDTYDGTGTYNFQTQTINRAISTGVGTASYFNLYTYNISGAGALGNSVGLMSHCIISSTGSGTVFRAFYGRVHTVSAGAAASLASFATHFEGTGSGGVGTYIGVSVGNVSGISGFTNTVSTLTNTYGIYIGTLTAGIQTNDPYAIYSTDANAKSYFAGNIGIGILPGGALLDVRGASDVDFMRIARTSDAGRGHVHYASGRYLGITVHSSDPTFSYRQAATGNASTSGNRHFAEFVVNFIPTSGTASQAILNLRGTFNQTGGANGITYGLLIDPTLTNFADFRAIDIIIQNNVLASAFRAFNGTYEIMRLYGNNNISMFKTGDFGGGEGVLFMGVCDTAPTANPGSGIILWVDSATGNYMARGSAGTITTIANA